MNFTLPVINAIVEQPFNGLRFGGVDVSVGILQWIPFLVGMISAVVILLTLTRSKRRRQKALGIVAGASIFAIAFGMSTIVRSFPEWAVTPEQANAANKQLVADQLHETKGWDVVTHEIPIEKDRPARVRVRFGTDAKAFRCTATNTGSDPASSSSSGPARR